MRKITVVALDYVFKLLIVWLLVSIMASCGSKKKTTSSVVEIQNNTDLQTSEAAATLETNSNILTTINKTNNSSETVTEANYKPIDLTKPSSVITPEGKKYVLDNAEVTERKTEKHNQSKSEETNAIAVSSLKNYWTKDTSMIQFENIHSNANSSLNKSGFNYWSWLWILILILVGIGLNYLNNRFKWVSYVTAFFRKK